MLLTNIWLIMLYIAVCIFSIYFIHKEGVKKNIFPIVFLSFVLVLNIYYYRSLDLSDILENDKYVALSNQSAELIAEEINNTSLDESTILDSLINTNIRRSIKKYDDEDIKDTYKENRYVVVCNGKNILDITIYGNFEYMKYRDTLYKFIN